ncbi:MAG: hypothetical protein ACE5FP_10515 [Gemmatimonadota bacterium]
MKTHTSMIGCESSPELEARVKALLTRVRDAIHDARFAKFALETSPAAHAVSMIVALDGGDTIVRHGNGPDWDRAFMELERRIDRLAESG